MLKYYSFELDDWQDNDWLIEVLKLFLDEEREVELNCWNDEIDAINLAIDLGFRVIEIQQFLIRLSGTTVMLDLDKIVSLKSFIQTTEEDEEENLLPFFSLFIKDEIFIEHYARENYVYNKEKFDLTVDILNRHNVEFICMNSDLSNSTAEKTVSCLLIDDLQDKNSPVEVLKLFLYEENEIELDCLNNEIDTINLAFDLGFRLIEIKPSLIRLKGTTSMLDLRKIMNFKEDSLFPFFFVNMYDSIIADQYFKELLIYKKDKFDLITAILKSNNVKFHY